MNPEKKLPSSLFEPQVKAVESSLESALGAKAGANIADNLRALHTLTAMNKFELEEYLSRGAIISLNDEEYERLHAKIKDLITANKDAARQQGLNLE